MPSKVEAKLQKEMPKHENRESGRLIYYLIVGLIALFAYTVWSSLEMYGKGFSDL
jgi:hypothetical protein